MSPGCQSLKTEDPVVISASRRTDIPAFYTQWLLNRIEAGSCDYFHAFSKRWSRVSLRPEHVRGIVFWTKNASPLIPHLPDLRALGYAFYIHFTITDLPRELEANIPPAGDAVKQVAELAAQFGSDCVQWRFDPIVHTTDIGADHTVRRFEKLCQALQGSTRRCFVSFMSEYRRQKAAFQAAGVEHVEEGSAERRDLAMGLAGIAEAHGITMYACCSPDLAVGGVQPGSCVDPELLRLNGASIQGTVRKAPSRTHCGCRKSVDIGAYDTCIGGCIYCYANRNKQLATENCRKHSPEHTALAEALMVKPDDASSQ